MDEVLKNNLIIILGILDNLHDLFSITIKNDSADNKRMFEYTLNQYKQFYLDYLGKNGINVKMEPFNNPIFDGIFNRNPIKNVNINKDKIITYVIDELKRLPISLTDINSTIINNFEIVFDIDTNIVSIFTTNLNTVVTNDEKILLRMPLYNLIKNFTDELFDFFMNYFNLDILDNSFIEKIKKQVKKNIKRITNNTTYPNTYLSDTTTGLTQKRLFNFNIMNISKSEIDQAKTPKPETYFDNYDNAKNYQGLFLEDNTALGIKVLETDKLDYIKLSCYLKDHLIQCNLTDQKLLLKFKKNNVGRKDDGYGLYQLLQDLKNIYELSLVADVPVLLDDFYDTFTKLQDTIDAILLLLNKVTIDKFTDDYIKRSYYLLSFYPRSNTIKELNIKYKLLYGKIDDLKSILKSTGNHMNKYEQIKLFWKILSDTRDNYSNIKLLEILGVLSLDECEDLLNYCKNISLLEINKEYLEKLSLFGNNIDDYYVGGIMTDKGLQFALYYYILNTKQIEEVIDTNNLYMILFNIHKLYSSSNLVFGCLVFILFGAKRFGDWVQAQIAKKYYFMLQSDDQYCQLYSYVIGGPVILKNNIYNLEMPNNLNEATIKVLGSVDKTGKVSNLDNQHILYRGIKTVQTPEVSRIYFHKYMKYKIKYYDLLKKFNSLL